MFAEDDHARGTLVDRISPYSYVKHQLDRLGYMTKKGELEIAR